MADDQEPPANQKQRVTWYTLTFQTGHHIGSLSGPVIQDGFTASFSFCILLFSFGFSLIIGVYLSPNQTVPVRRPVEELILVIIILVACALMIWMIWKRDSLGKYHDNVEDEDEEGWQVADVGDDHEIYTEEEDDSNEDDDFDDFDEDNSGNVMEHMRKTIRDKLPLIGIGFFFLLGIYLDLIRVVAHFNCMPIFIWYCNSYKNFWIISDIFFHISRIVFMSVAMTFTIQFNGMSFNRSIRVHYSLLTLAAVTLVLWFESLLHDFQTLFNGTDQEDFYFREDCARNLTIINNITNITISHGGEKDSNNSIALDILKCVERKTGLYSISEQMAPYFYPLTIEFTLLVCEQLAHLLFHIDNEQAPEQNDDEHNNEDALNQEPEADSQRSGEGVDSDGDVNDNADDSHSASETDALLPRRRTTVSSSSGPGPSMASGDLIPLPMENPATNRGTPNYGSINQANGQIPNENDTRISYPGIVPISILLGIIFNALYLVVAMLGFFEEIKVKQYCTVYSSFKVVHWVVQLLCYFKGFAYTVNFKSKKVDPDGDHDHGHGGLHMLVIVSSGGYYIYAFLSIFACVGYMARSHNKKDLSEFDPELHSETPVILLDILLNIVCIFLQMSFMLHVTHVRPPASGEGTAQRNRRYRHILLYLAMCNAVFWFADSFLEINSLKKSDPVQVYYYGEETWKTVNHITMPLVFFVRFNSIFILLGAYLDVK